VQAADPLRTGRLHGGVRKGNAELVALINRGFDRITSDELDAITARWTGLRLAQSAPVPWRSIALVGLGLVLLLVLVHATLLRIQVQRRTRELIASRETLRETSRLLATVFNAIPDPIGVIDREYNLVRVNRAGEAFTHQFPTSDSGLCCYQKLGRNTPCEPCPTREAFETGTTALCEKHEPATGAWFEVRAYPLLDADGHVIRVVEHLRDVTEARRSREELKEAHASLEQTVADRTRELEATNRQLQAEVEERRRTEEQLRRERRLFHDLVMLNPYAILVTDVDGHVKLSNPRIESLIGRPIETPRETYSIFADPQIVEAGIADRIRALGAGECLYLPEYRYDFGRLNPASSGESQRLCLRSVVFPVHDADGVLQNYVVMHEDITESKELQEQLIQSERMAAVGTLAGGVAHEFNNINTTVLGFAQLLLAELPDEAPEREHLSRIAKAARRAADITRNLLTFAGGGGGRGERRDVLLETILEETLHLVEDKFRADGVVFERAYEATPIIHADPAQIGQVVLNLLINARHALLDRPDKRIRLAIQSTDGTATLKVIDNGIGISEDNLRLIFTPFFSTKGEHSTRGHPEAVHRGAGLGLSVSRTIAESHGGHLSAESREGAGSTFRLTLPLGTGDDDAQQHPAPRPERDWGRLAALVVEDESDITELVRLCLRRAGCRVETSDDGAVALRRLEEERFDLLALDLHMPRMHGQEILDSMAGLPADRRPACLVMTGRQEDTDEAACRAAGAHAFLRKPFDEPAFLDAADEALRARG
ncbi:MAG: ATP-binding protein, partial [Planctomycetota bacterium]